VRSFSAGAAPHCHGDLCAGSSPSVALLHVTAEQQVVAWAARLCCYPGPRSARSLGFPKARRRTRLYADGITLMAAITPTLAIGAAFADENRQAEVAAGGAQVMPFKLSATTHIFTKTPSGGIQKVVAKDPNSIRSIRTVNAIR
jgi:hypothetical protein